MRTIKDVVIWKTVTIAVIVCLLLSLLGWLGIHHIDTQAFFYFFGNMGAILAILWNNNKTKQVHDKVERIEEQTNGNLQNSIAQAMEDIAIRVEEGDTSSANKHNH